MTHLTDEQNERLRAAMRAAIKDKFDGSQLALAEAIDRSPPSLSDFLNRKNGASQETAELFATRVAKRPVEDVIGVRKIAPVTRLAPPKPEGGGYPVDPETRRRALVLMRQPPQQFSDEAIAIAEECVVFKTAEEARNPSFVAELWRLAILGTAATLPRPSTPSDPPAPAGTRRSRRRA